MQTVPPSVPRRKMVLAQDDKVIHRCVAHSVDSVSFDSHAYRRFPIVLHADEYERLHQNNVKADNTIYHWGDAHYKKRQILNIGKANRWGRFLWCEKERVANNIRESKNRDNRPANGRRRNSSRPIRIGWRVHNAILFTSFAMCPEFQVQLWVNWVCVGVSWKNQP